MSRRLRLPYSLLSLCFVSVFSATPPYAGAQNLITAPPPTSVARPANVQLPVTFEMNRGQAAPDVVAIARTTAGVVKFKQHDMLLPVPGSAEPILIGVASAPDSIAPESPSGGVANYISGRDRSRWLQGLPLYHGIRYKSVTGGIDLVLRGTEGQLEFDFDLAPKADVSMARLVVEGAASLKLQPDTSLLLTQPNGHSLRLVAPTAFQYRNGSRTSVDASFEIHGQTIGFRLGAYDPQLPLVIDPVVAWTTLIPISNEIYINGMAVNSSGDVIFGGSTVADDYPVVSGTSRASGSAQQLFVTELDPTGVNILFSTYIPSAADSEVSSLVLDSAGNIYIAGVTGDPAFPVTSPNLGSCSQSCSGGFVAKLDPAGKVVYSTLIGFGQLPKGLAVNAAGEAYVAGLSADAGLKTVNAYDPNYGGGLCTSCSDAFFGKLNAGGTNWVFSSYFPIQTYFPPSSTLAEPFITALAVDPSGNLYIGGIGPALNLMRPLAIESSAATTDPGYSFIAKYSSDGQKLLFSTDLPALTINGIQAGADGTLFIAGEASPDFPYTVGSLASPFPPLWALNDSTNGMFAAAIDPAEDGFSYAAYLGQGSVYTTVLGPDGNFYIAGAFNVSQFLPSRNALETDISTGGFVLSLTPTGQLAASTPFGGHFEEQIPSAMAVDSSGDIFLASSPSPNGTLSGDPLDPVNVGSGQTYSSQLALGTNSSFIGYTASIDKISPAAQPQISLSYLGPYLILRDAGSADLHISGITYSGGLQKSWGNCGATVPAGASCFLVPGTNSGLTSGGSITINSDALPAQQTFTPLVASGLPIPSFVYVQDETFVFPPQVDGSTSPTQSLQLTNIGASSTVVTVGPNGPSTALQVNSNCGTLTPGESCTAEVDYAPTSSQEGTGGLLLLNSSTGQISMSFPNVLETGLNNSDPLQFSAPILHFGTVVVGQSSLSRPVTITNATNSPISVPAPVISDPEFTVSGNSCTSALQPGQTCAIAFVFTPSAAVAKVVATLSLADDTTQVYLIGTPLAVPAVTANPLSLTFGPLTAGANQAQTVNLSNTGTAAAPVNAVLSSSPAFTESDNCVGSLAGLQSCTITVSFVPDDQLGAFSGSLWISLNGGTFTVPIALAGTSTTDVTSSTSTLNFASPAYTGTTSSSLPVVLTNVSTSAQSINPVFNGPFAASSIGCASSLPPSQSCTVNVDFAPTQAGSEQGSMTVAFSDGTPSLVVQLAGSAVAAPPIVTIAPQSGSSTSATVAGGQTASYQLIATASAIFSGTVTLTCTGAPANSNCTLSPSSFALTPGAKSNITVNVATGATTSAQQQHGSISPSNVRLALVVPALLLVFWRRRISRCSRLLLLLTLPLIAAFGIAACGGGSSTGTGGGGGGGSSNTPSGTYTLMLSVSSGSQSVQQSLTLTVQ